MKKSVALCFMVCCVLCAGMSKKPKFTISIHGEGSQEDNPRMIFPENVGGQKVIFKLVPEFSQTNISAIHPFPAADGNGFGVALKLDFRGTNALEMATRMRVGTMLLTKVNGRSCDLVTIDRPVSDGLFTIWNGVPEEVIMEMKKQFPDISRSRSVGGGGVEMTATTKKEKRDQMRRIEAEDKKKAKKEADAAAGKEDKPKGGFFGLFGKRKPETPRDDGVFTQGPTTSQIPLEGAAPQPRTPDPAQPIPLNQPLPQR